MGLRAFFLSMRAVRLDDETADRMLAGGVGPADAPPGYAAVAALLQTARSAAGVPVPAANPSHPPVDLGLADTASGAQAVRRPRSGRRRIPVLAAVAFCAMTGGAYAAGVTGAGSSTVSAVLDRIGVGSLVGSPVRRPDRGDLRSRSQGGGSGADSHGGGRRRPRGRRAACLA